MKQTIPCIEKINISKYLDITFKRELSLYSNSYNMISKDTVIVSKLLKLQDEAYVLDVLHNLIRNCHIKVCKIVITTIKTY